MLAEAGRRLADARGDARVELVRGNALDLSFDQEFDVVTCVGALGHIERHDEPRFVQGIWRALRPGGRFVFATGELPPLTSPWRWLAHAFNGAMHVRNALLKPEFVMYYLTFAWPEVRTLLECEHFRVKAMRNVCPPPFERVLVVVATR
jgi:2-polyprenyl-3-methyl-5-hydroxy-6-metoxy-1,4-benzoquinol methylase